MHIEDELGRWLTTSIPDKRQHKLRNAKVVLNYYGFGELAWPTLEEIRIKFKVGTRERVRQVINASFRDAAELKDLPVATKIFGIIESHECVPIPEIRAQLVREGLVSGNTTLRGLLNLARNFGACQDYDLYDSSLETLSRSGAEFDSKTFLVRKDARIKLKMGLKRARTLPGLLGLAKFDYLRAEIEDSAESERLIQFVRSAPNACIVLDGSEEWYVVPGRKPIKLQNPSNSIPNN